MSNCKLLFTRNIELKEFFDLLYKSVIKKGEIIPGVESEINLRLNNLKLNPRTNLGVQFRHGIDSQYGEIIFVMRDNFYEIQKKQYKMLSIWRRPWNIENNQKSIGNFKFYEVEGVNTNRILDEENRNFKKRENTIWIEKNVLNPGAVHDMDSPSWSNIQLHIFEDIELFSENSIKLLIKKPENQQEILFNMDMSKDKPEDIAQELFEASLIEKSEKTILTNLLNEILISTDLKIKGNDKFHIEINQQYNIEKILFPKWLTSINNHEKIKSITDYNNLKYNDQFYEFLFKLFNLEEKLTKDIFPYNYDFYGESENPNDYYFYIHNTNYLRRNLNIEPRFKDFNFGLDDSNYLYFRITLNQSRGVNNSSQIGLSPEVFTDLEKKYLEMCPKLPIKGGFLKNKIKTKKKIKPKKFKLNTVGFKSFKNKKI